MRGWMSSAALWPLRLAATADEMCNLHGGPYDYV